MPKSRFTEIQQLAEQHDGLVTSAEARAAGISDSTLVRMMKRGRLERIARGVYRLPFMGIDRFGQHREAILWITGNRGPKLAAISHQSALALYGISDANPDRIHVSVPGSTRLRRAKPEWIVIHQTELSRSDLNVHEGLPVTSVARTIEDLVGAHTRNDLLRQAVGEARREGFISQQEARRLGRILSFSRPDSERIETP
jgi:predicted transcriptional regulator of viral defense system